MKAENIFTRQLRIEDWELLRNMRLMALKECEGMYLDTYENAKNSPKNRWKDIISGSDKAMFGLFHNESHIGIASIFTSRDDPSGKTSILAMGYIIPQYRRKGLVSKLYKARMDWAQNHPIIEKIEISHRKDNEASRRSIIKHGFEFTGEKRIRFGDGQEDTDCNYVLPLKK